MTVERNITETFRFAYDSSIDATSDRFMSGLLFLESDKPSWRRRLAVGLRSIAPQWSGRMTIKVFFARHTKSNSKSAYPICVSFATNGMTFLRLRELSASSL